MRLPDRTKLIQGIPSASRPLASSDTGERLIAASVDDLGAGVQQLGVDLKKQQAEKDDFDLLMAKTYFQRENARIIQGLREEPDYENYETKYQERISQVKDIALGLVNNKEKVPVFNLDLDGDINDSITKIKDVQYGKRIDLGKAKTIEAITQNLDFIKSIDDPNLVKSLSKNNELLIDTAVKNGFFDEADAIKFKNVGKSEIAMSNFQREYTKDPNEAYKKLNKRLNMKGDGGGEVTADFAIDFIIDNFEGEAFVANDAGRGATKFGVNISANTDVDVENLDRQSAKKVLIERYWNAVNADNLPNNIRLIAADTAVNHGQGFADKIIKQSGGDPKKMLELREQEYNRLIKANPEKYAKYAKSWQNRLNTLEGMVGTDSLGSVMDIPYDEAARLQSVIVKETEVNRGKELKLMSENPWASKFVRDKALESGVEDIGSIDFFDPNSLLIEYEKRKEAATKLGVPNMPILRQEEAEQIRTIYKDNPQAALELMAYTFPESSNKVAREIFKDDMANVAVANLYKDDRQLALNILNGRKIVEGKTATGKLPKDIEPSISPRLLNVPLSQEERKAILSAASYLYAHEATEEGKLDDKIVNKKIMDKVFTKIIGEPIEIEDYKLLPFRKVDGKFVTEEEFEAVYNDLSNESLKARGLPLPYDEMGEPVDVAVKKGDGKLIPMGDGVYKLVSFQEGMPAQVFTTKDGKEDFTIDFKKFMGTKPELDAMFKDTLKYYYY